MGKTLWYDPIPIFKSKDFQLISDNVIFDRKNLIATSDNESKFSSKNSFSTMSFIK